MAGMSSTIEVHVVHANRLWQSWFAVDFHANPIWCQDVHLVGVLGRMDLDPGGVPPSQRGRHVLHHEAEVIDDAAGGRGGGIRFAEHDEHTREPDQLP